RRRWGRRTCGMHFTAARYSRVGSTPQEGDRIVALHQEDAALRIVMPQGDDGYITDSHLFWVPRTTEIEWIFARIWDVATQYNSAYGFELFEQMGQLQLTRYAKDQLYNWHTD